MSVLAASLLVLSTCHRILVRRRFDLRSVVGRDSAHKIIIGRATEDQSLSIGYNEQDESVGDPFLMLSSSLDRLRGVQLQRWPNIAAAKNLSAERLAELSALAAGLLPTDEGSFIVFGSLARGEFTQGSDLDWTILIDGRAESKHLDIVHDLKPSLKDAGYPPPGPTEVFGGLVFSHELIHAIGGDEDTNRNMTRRLLLILESASVNVPGSQQVRKRIIQGILNRYVVEDASFIRANRRTDKITRFLLNDVVRFWRTMAVDYANKYRIRGGEKWALRNVKLRMSRKLLFVSGLFMCISLALEADALGDPEFVVQNSVSHLMDWSDRPPLESLATVVEKYAPYLAEAIFDPYDEFLLLLNDEKRRGELEVLAPDDAYGSEVFLEARETAHRFDEALLQLIFETNSDITRLVKKYGVF